MSTDRFLKKIRRWAQEDQFRSEIEIDDLTASVIDDLEKMYNTRQGTVMLDTEFGLPDFTSMMNSLSPSDIENLTRAFIMTTNRYESRLKNVTVRFNKKEGDLGVMRFSVSCKIAHAEQLYPMKFDALLQGDGSVTLQA